MGDFSVQAERFRILSMRRDGNIVRINMAIQEYYAAGGGRLHVDDPEKARLLREALDRAEAEIDRLAGRSMNDNDAIVLEYDEAIAGSDIIREIEGK